jgi:hypothetical protein
LPNTTPEGADSAVPIRLSSRQELTLTQMPEGRRPILVVSHERSGTHFTMNAIAKCFDYISNPWTDLDRHHININYFYPEILAQTVCNLGEHRPQNILKSHHEAAFFEPVLREVAEVWDIVYVHRHPADVLASYWRLLNTLPWAEGPKTSTALELATAAPMARILRYQHHQHPTMLDRWANHVRGWVDLADRTGLVHAVRYEDLSRDYEATMRRMGERFGLTPVGFEKPSRTEHVVKGGPVPFNPSPADDNRQAVGELARVRYPELMARLGYAAKRSAVG